MSTEILVSARGLRPEDFADLGDGERLDPVHPGQILQLDFLEPLGLSCAELARQLDVPANRISSIVNGSRSVSAETALLLAERFDTTGEFWLNLQMRHDLEVARRQPRSLRIQRPA